MHPIMTEQIAAERMAELRREADRWQRLHELRSAGGSAATGHRRWTRTRRALRRLRPAVA